MLSLDEHPTIEAPRVRVRPVAASDLADLLLINGDDEVTRFLPYATWKGPADGEAWLARTEKLCATDTARQLVIVERATAQVIGTCLVFRYDKGSARAEIGYVMGRAHWRKGYTREALAAVIDFAFRAWALRRLEAEVNPANVASNAILRTLGFVHEGLLRERWAAKGSVYDSNFYGLLREEWRGRDQLS